MNLSTLNPKLSTFSWNATAFFEDLTERNRLAHAENFTFAACRAWKASRKPCITSNPHRPIVAVSDTSEGYMDMNNTPRTRRIKTVFLAMRHALDDMQARQRCFDTLRELFRQFMSVLLQEKTRLEQNRIYLDPQITFTEIERYFFSGAACAYFHIAIDTFTDLRYRAEEWETGDLKPE